MDRKYVRNEETKYHHYCIQEKISEQRNCLDHKHTPFKALISFSDYSIKGDLTQGVSYVFEGWLLINTEDFLCFFFDPVSEGFGLDYFNT